MRRRLSGVRIIKRSIDARKERVMVNLKVRAYIDEPMSADYLVPPIIYRRVKGDRQAIVVGAGPGGLHRRAAVGGRSLRGGVRRLPAPPARPARA